MSKEMTLQEAVDIVRGKVDSSAEKFRKAKSFISRTKADIEKAKSAIEKGVLKNTQRLEKEMLEAERILSGGDKNET